jgi:hypothetical protein
MSPIGNVGFTHISTLTIATGPNAHGSADSRRQSADLYDATGKAAIHFGMFNPFVPYPQVIGNVTGQEAENSENGTGQVSAAAGAIAGVSVALPVPGLAGLLGALDAVGFPNSIPLTWF